MPKFEWVDTLTAIRSNLLTTRSVDLFYNPKPLDVLRKIRETFSSTEKNSVQRVILGQAISPEILAELEMFPNLNYLDISNLSVTYNQAFWAQLAKFVNLKSLFLAGTGLNTSGLEHISLIGGLAIDKLELSENTLTDSDIADIAKILTSLETLILKKVTGITTDGIKTALAELESLSSLDVRFCPDIPDPEKVTANVLSTRVAAVLV
jgi:hypothetical protein